ncbi:MAG: glycoside hydrolase family 108 protein [Deferribacterales bacterium]
MADLNKALKKLWSVEFSNRVDLMLHTIAGDRGGMTYKGIARKYHPAWDGWAFIDANPNPEMLEKNMVLQDKVEMFYHLNFWNKIKGDSIAFQAVAEELFLSAVNIGIKKAVMLAQEVSGTKIDGVFGEKTLMAINNVNASDFCERYTELEMQYYEDIVERKPKQKKFFNGWIARANVINGDNAGEIA